jgi:hypothetical protein
MYRTGHKFFFCVPYGTEINGPFINFDMYFILRLEIISLPISITSYVSSQRAYSGAVRAGMVLQCTQMEGSNASPVNSRKRMKAKVAQRL